VSDITVVFIFESVRILPLIPGLCANPATIVFARRRIRAAIAAINTRASRSPNVVVRQSLAEDRIRAEKARRKTETIRLLADVLRVRRSQ
jgi:hypothetical protein